MDQKDIDRIKDEIFSELREQEDRKTDVTVDGFYEINPQELVKNPVFGPLAFKTAFKTSPIPVFGQIMSDPNQLFVAQPYVVRWEATSGAVEGFYLGVYALTAVPTGLFKHKITWHMKGKASNYHNDGMIESWQMGYDLESGDAYESDQEDY